MRIIFRNPFVTKRDKERGSVCIHRANEAITIALRAIKQAEENMKLAATYYGFKNANDMLEYVNRGGEL